MRAIQLLMVVVCLTFGSADAKPAFKSSVVGGRCSELMHCDLDGDGLEDLVMVDDCTVHVFFQDASAGFTRELQTIHHLERRPSIVWTAKLGGRCASLLVMTSDGVTELSFTNRAGPVVSQPIIKEPTIIPESGDGTNVLHIPFSAQRGSRAPLILVPTLEGIQIWERGQEWGRKQVITNSIQSRIWPSLGNPGYNRKIDCELSVNDLNADGRDDLIVKSVRAGRSNVYTAYLQQTNGMFDVNPVMEYSERASPYTWLCWVDLNKDGRLDLIRSVWQNEPSFIPGIPSGKVIVSLFIADAQGRIPSEPQQVFRKSDWIPVLPVVDIDGDGYLDLVLGQFHMDSREGVRKQITSKQLDYTLGVSLYRPGTGFPKEADFQREVTIQLQRAEVGLNWSLPQTFNKYVKVGGDFNGDGKADLVVRDRKDGLAGYFFVSREQGFSREADVRFTFAETIEELEVADLNNDGISDLIVKLADEEGVRVFMSQK